MSDNIRPNYYDPASPYEPLKVIDAWGLGFRLGSVLKYLARAGKKHAGIESTIEDLRKARTYIDLEIRHLESSGGTHQLLSVEELVK